MKKKLTFWLLILIIWVISTLIDRYYWTNLSGIPSWDQADYLNSAIDHGRALGLLPGGGFEGFKSFLDLSPKIPPLASIINGSIIAIAGDDPSQAAWSLSIWNGLLLFSIAQWGIKLRSKGFALLGVAFVSIAPALVQLRTDYVLEMPLTASIALSTLLLGEWLNPQTGGKWIQALLAALSITISLLVKQSSLLVFIPAFLFTIASIYKRKRSSLFQFLFALVIICIGLLPWMKHNWITFISGTNRSVIESAVKEGDPSLFSIENWIWYLRLIGEQIGILILLIGLSGIILYLLNILKTNIHAKNKYICEDNIYLWKWLIFILFTSWLFTSLSPNKDARYITPILPFAILLISRGWWHWKIWLEEKMHHSKDNYNNLLVTIFIGIIGTAPQVYKNQIEFISHLSHGPLKEIIAVAGGGDPREEKKTLIVIPSTPDLNQHNVSYYGRQNGGQLVGRQLGNNPNDLLPLLTQGELILLAEGEQGSIRNSAMSIDKAIRKSKFFSEVKRFPRKKGGSYSLWKRNRQAPTKESFAKSFPQLAKNLEIGPKGLESIFNEIAIQHMIDGHLIYQDVVENEALAQLNKNDEDINAYWTLSLLNILRNRPYKASIYLKKLIDLLPNNPWPSTYLIIVEIANWKPWEAKAIAKEANKIHSNHLLLALEDVSGLISGEFWKIHPASQNIPKAIEEIEGYLN